jgi:UDP-3-O-[3-hydroxymyristoyl] N-acetylglucosamine deacetylase
MILQKTIASKISCSGIGIHSGKNTSITFLPASCDSGIIFKRVDVKDKNQIIKANYQNVVETKLGTTIANSDGIKVLTIEHLMAAICGCGIDNLIIEITEEEIPIMDGSSEPFVFLIECAGIISQEKPKKIIEIIKKISIEEDGKIIEVEPSQNLIIDLKIDFNHSQIKQEQFIFDSKSSSFKNDICRARTFGFKKEIEQLRRIGLACGGSLENAILVDDDKIINESGLRYEDEFVKHKMLDFIGDIYLAGFQVLGKFKVLKCGHSINNKFLQKLFANQDCWREVFAS